MAIDQRQAEILATHLKRLGVACPLCGSKSWTFVDIVSFPHRSAARLTSPGLEQLLKNEKFNHHLFGTPARPKFTTSGALSLTAGEDSYFPVAIASCMECFYLIELAWLPIVAKARREGR